MVGCRKVESVDEFVFRAKELFIKRPEAVRYSFKYRHKDGRLSAKVTDDMECLTHSTDKRADIYVIQRLNEWYFSSCTGKKRPRFESERVKDEAADSESAGVNDIKTKSDGEDTEAAGAAAGTSQKQQQQEQQQDKTGRKKKKRR